MKFSQQNAAEKNCHPEGERLKRMNICVCIEHSEKFCCFIAEMRNGGVKIYSQILSLLYKSAVNRSGVIKYQKKNDKQRVNADLRDVIAH